jgi:hypothetical protein
MYSTILKKLTLTKWRWPLIPFAAVALVFVFTFFLVLDAVFGSVFLVLLISGACLVFVAEVFDPNEHALIRARITAYAGEVIAAFARHPKIVATLRNPRWWVALPAWLVVLPFVISWSVVRELCRLAADVVRNVDEKLHALADAGLFKHMRKLYAWVFAGAKS